MGIIQFLIEFKNQASENTQNLLTKAIDKSMALLKKSIAIWINRGEIPKRAPYFFVKDLGPSREWDGEEEYEYDALQFTDRFVVASGQVPQSKISLETAERLCFIGGTTHLFRLREGAGKTDQTTTFDPLDPSQVLKLFEETQEKLNEWALKDAKKSIQLVRDTFLLGRCSNWTKLAKQSFEQTWTPICLDGKQCSYVITPGTQDNDPIGSISRKSKQKTKFASTTDEYENSDLDFAQRDVWAWDRRLGGWEKGACSNRSSIVFAQKLQVDKGFEFRVDEISIVRPGSKEMQLGGGISFFAQNQWTQDVPDVSVFLTKEFVALFLDGCEVNRVNFHEPCFEFRDVRWAFRTSQTEDDRPSVSLRLNLSYGLGSDRNEAISLKFAFEDDLVSPKWLDANGRSWFGALCSICETSTRVSQPIVTASAMRSKPALQLKRQSAKTLLFFPSSCFEELNGVYARLTMINKTSENLSRAFFSCRKHPSLCRLRFAMAQFVSTLMQHMQIQVVDSAISELLSEFDKPYARVEHLRECTRITVERIVQRCSLANVSATYLMESALRQCASFCISVDKNEFNDDSAVGDAFTEFHGNITGLITALGLSSSALAMTLKEALDVNGFWSARG